MNKVFRTKSALNGRFFILLLLAFTCGALTHLSFAPYHIQWLAPLSLAVFYASLISGRKLSARQHLGLGLGFGGGLFSFGIRWVHVSIDNFGGLPLVVSLFLMLLLSLYLACFAGICCYLFARFKLDPTQRYWAVSNALLFSSLWVLSELARGKVLTGFPWLWLGYSQTQGIFSHNGATIGVIGLSLLICLTATLLATAVINRSASAVAGLVITVLFAYGLNRVTTITVTDNTVDVALVQGNIEQSAKWQADKMWPTITSYMDLTRDHFDADIIFWPEAAMPAVEDWITDYLRLMDKSANFRDSAIITGLISRQHSDDAASSDARHYYNALVSVGNAKQKIQPAGNYQPQHSNRYYKHQLLPIGEFVPFEALLRPLAPLFNLPMSSFHRGAWQQPNLEALGYQIAPAICYEIAFPELVRANMTPATDLLLTVSNDAWFGRSIGPHQHMEIAQMRAIELGRPLLRVTNNGITAIVDAGGAITAQLPQFEQGVLRGQVPLVSGQTYFYRWGQWPVIGLTLLCLATIISRKWLKAKPALD